MSDRPRTERLTQERVINLFTSKSHPNYLGYDFLGDWHAKDKNSCIETDLLQENLSKRGYSPIQISAALQKLLIASDSTGISLYQANLRTYNLLRYGVKVQTGIGKSFETVHLIDWEQPENNNFAVAEEVTLKSGYERRPDIVLYLNGLAIGVIELKRSSVDLIDGIRQLNTNQEEIFNKEFFSTVQLVFAGNDSQGLRYGTIGMPEQYFLKWKENITIPSSPGYLLDKPLSQICDKSRLLDLIYNGIIFDAGIKKIPRVHQYFGLKKAQERIKKREGGVIWHTQGSGKSILMVLLAKWILENEPEARVLIITDRDELDKQIEGVMKNSGVVSKELASPRITSRRDLLDKLSTNYPRLLCALIHKFDLNLKSDPPKIQGKFYVFVDECHRTQGGGMNRQMKRWMEGCIFIGFTGTPLLKRDKKTTIEVFGSYIHTYKFDEAVEDGVILDLKYEARAVPQRLTSGEAIDNWFKHKTKTLNNYQQALLRKHWATMEQLMSAGERKQRIIASIIQDFSLKPRLDNNRGTGILVAASIYDACHYFRLFQNTSFGKYCGIITSYEPNHNSISREPPDSDERYKFDTYTQHVLISKQKTKTYETEIKKRFINEPANCKLLIVVSKLLTGFDAPSCTYIYLDNEIHDHNLFQAICRTNRLDGDDKDYGYIVDFKELFYEVQSSISVYTSDELDIDDKGETGNPIVKNWLKEGKNKLDKARESLLYLCEPVELPKELEQYIKYFCGNSSDPNSLKDTEPLRITFYKSVVTFVRSYASIAQDLEDAGYLESEIKDLKNEIVNFSDIRNAIKQYSNEELDIKPYEADMRHLLNTYIHADQAEDLGNLSELSLTELIVKTGIHDAIAKKLNAKGNLSRNIIAEGIINNIRKTIIREQLTDPRFYEAMSLLLNDLIKQKRSETDSYEEFLKKSEALVKKLSSQGSSGNYPSVLEGNKEAIVLFNNLERKGIENNDERNHENNNNQQREIRAKLALKIDKIMREKAPADFRGDEARERQILNEIFLLLNRDREKTIMIFDVIKQQKGY